MDIGTLRVFEKASQMGERTHFSVAVGEFRQAYKIQNKWGC